MGLNNLATHPLQTSYWMNFRKAWGNEALETKWGLLTVHRLPCLPAGRHLPYKIGIFEKAPAPTGKQLLGLRKLAKEKNCVFIKLEPNAIKSNSLIQLLSKSGAVKGRRLFTPTTFWIDLTKSEEELLGGFSPKTRYNIRLAQRAGVQVQEDDSDKAFEKYLELTKETSQRQGFYAHTEKYHRLMWKYLHQLPISNSQFPIARLLTATYKGEVVTTWILFVWKDFLYYPYGASTDKYKNIMANNLIMWEAIRFGKKLGLKTFDLWGREEGKGFTRFKEGYSPKVVELVGTWDLVINKPIYYLYRIAEEIRWFFLHLKKRL